MTNKPDPGRCVHCLQFYDELTWDHVFPKSWYPDTTPEDIEKWKIPACLSCNKEYGRIEEELLIKLGLCINPQNPRGAGIAFKAVRALRSDYANNDKDAELRKRKKEKIFREAKYGMDIPKESIYPGYEYKGKDIDEQMGLLLEDGKIRKLTEKIVRGIMFISDKKYIESLHYIQFYAYNHDALRNIFENVYPGPFEVFERPPGLVVLRALAVEDQMSGIYLIDIWGQLFCVAIVHKHVNTV